MSKDSVSCSQANLLQVCYWSSPPPPIAFTIVPFSWRACSSLACVYKIVYLANPYFLYASYAGQTNEKSNTFTVKLPLPKQITRGPLRMDAQVLGSIVVYIYLSDLAFCVPETFYAKFPVLVKSVFKIVTRALPLRCVTGAVFVCFLGQRENYEGAREARVFPRALCETTQQTNWGHAARDKKPQTPRAGFSVFISCFSLN